MKLTDEQWGLLCLAGQGVVDTTWGHPDAAALVELGLVTIRHCVPASTFVGGQVVKITPAGRAALSQNDGGSDA